MKQGTKRLLSLLLILVLAGSLLPNRVAAVSPLPNLKLEGSILSWDHPSYDGSETSRQYTFWGLTKNSGYPIALDYLSSIQEFCDVQWTSSGVRLNLQDYLEYISASKSSEPLEAGTYIIRLDFTGAGADTLASSSFAFDFAPRSSGVHRIDVDGGRATPRLAKPGTLVGVQANEKPGHAFDHWQIDFGKLTLKDPGKAVTSFTMPSEDVKLTAVYYENATEHQITLLGGGTLQSKYKAYPGEKVNIWLNWESGDYIHQFVRWEVVSGGVTLAELDSFDTFFTMPDSDVVIRVVYEGQEDEPEHPFVDVETSDYFSDPVIWAYYHRPQITTGTDDTHFSPGSTCTRGQVVTFLWRASGAPEPTLALNPFTDVKADQYYYKAVLWAVQNGITTGTSATTFSPNASCTRGQVVTFLHRAQGKPAPGSSVNPFTDVPAGQYYYDAVLWAVNHSPQITNGTSATTFSPNATCTRGQIVTFLYRAMK